MTLLLTVLAILGAGPSFCDGYRFGWRAGYCHAIGARLLCSPSVPSCPGDDGTYMDGYNKGYDDGESAGGN